MTASPFLLSRNILHQSIRSSRVTFLLKQHHQHQQKCNFKAVVDHRLKALMEQAEPPRKPRKPTHNQNSKSSQPSYRFVDRTRVRVSGGMGGKGSLSMSPVRRKKYMFRPDGGNGGNGGSVLLVADPNEQTLRWSHPHVQAHKGANGDSQNCHGRNGNNRIIRVPCGVVVKRILDRHEYLDPLSGEIVSLWNNDDDDLEEDDDSETYFDEDEVELSPEVVAALEAERQAGTQLDDDDRDDDDDDSNDPSPKTPMAERERVVLADLDQPGANVLVARGGRGGWGTCRYASFSGPPPEASHLVARAQPAPGEVAFLELELKLIADVGLVGFPNAGKSSLLRAMSRASPAVAPYPFTTLHPLMGCVDYRDGYQVRVADIPGLIDGAAQGRGKGHDFLRHIERTKVLLYLVDMAGVDFRNPVEDLEVLVNEIASYGDGTMMDRKALVVANKVDLVDDDRATELVETISDTADALGIQTDHEVLTISAGVTGEGLGSLSKAMRRVVEDADQESRFWYESQSHAAS